MSQRLKHPWVRMLVVLTLLGAGLAATAAWVVSYPTVEEAIVAKYGRLRSQSQAALVFMDASRGVVAYGPEYAHGGRIVWGVYLQRGEVSVHVLRAATGHVAYVPCSQSEGAYALVRSVDKSSDEPSGHTYLGPVYLAPAVSNLGGFGVDFRLNTAPRADLRPGVAKHWGLYVPLWFIVSTSWAGAWWLGRRLPGHFRSTRAEKGLCPHCGYDLRVQLAGEAGGRCPECGQAVATKCTHASLQR